MPRPSLSGTGPSRLVTIKMSEPDRKIIYSAAKRHGLSVSEFARRVLLAASQTRKKPTNTE